MSLLSDAQGASVGAVSCASAHSCIAVGTKDGTVGYGVATSGTAAWSAPDVIDTDVALPSLSGGTVDLPTVMVPDLQAVFPVPS